MRCFLKMLLCGVALVAVPALDAAELSVEDFAALPVIRQPSVSPDGSRIAAMVRNEAGYYDVMVTPFEKDDFIRVASLVKAYDRIDWIRWANNERLLVAASKPANLSRFKFRVSKLYSIDVSNGETVQLSYRDPGNSLNAAEQQAGRDDSRLVSILREDPAHILVELWTMSDTGPSVFKVNIYDNTFEKIVTNDFHVRSWYANQQGEVLFGLGINPDERDNSRIQRIWFRESVDDEWELLREREIGTDEYFNPVIGTLDGDTITVLSDHAIGRVGLYRYNIRSGEYEELLFAADRHDLNGILTIDRRMVGVQWVEHYVEQKFFDPADAKLSDLVKNTFQGAHVYIESSDRARKKLVIGAVRDDMPRKYYLLDLAKGEARFWFSQYPQLENIKLPAKQPFEYTARDGMVLNGYLTLPLENDGEKPPLVVLPHGGPHARDTAYFNYWTQFLASRGYAVLQPNFRGSSGFGSAYEAAGYKEWGGKMQDDVLDAVAWVGEQELADTGNMCLVGASYGGYVALTASFQTPEMFDCLVSIAGIADLEAMVDGMNRIMGRTDSVDNLMVGDPNNSEDLEKMRVHSAINHVAKIQRPLLLIHGDHDTRVLYQQTERFYEKAQRLDKDVTYIKQEDGTHFLDFGPHRLEAFKAMEAFLAEHLQ